MGILQLLAKENYITYHKTLARVVGVDEAILFGELCSMSNLYGDEFFCEQSKLINDTCLTEYRIRNALKNLQKENLVSVVKKGLPAKNWYILNENKLLELLDCQSTSGTNFDTTGNDTSDTTCSKKSDSTFNKNTSSKNTKSKNTQEKDIPQAEQPPAPKSEPLIDYELFKSTYNKFCSSLPQVRMLTEKRKKAIRAFLNELDFIDFETACKKANESSFLTGQNDRGWKADFDFIIRVDKALNIIEGKHDGKAKGSNSSSFDTDDFFQAALKKSLGKNTARAILERQTIDRMDDAEKNPPKTAGEDEGIRKRMEALKQSLGQ